MEQKESTIILQETINCIRCSNKAILHTGHVIDDATGNKIIAGWCREHSKELTDKSDLISSDNGYVCKYNERMGKRPFASY